mgnify:CR=1 FL=1
MIHCTNLKRFPQYLKCPRVNHSITSDENSPRPPFKRPGLSLSYLKCLQMGGGSRPLLENVQKEAAFSSVWLPLVDQRFVINATELPRLIFFKLAYIIFSEIILLFPSSVGVCVFESVNRTLEWIFTIYQYVLLRLLVRWSWSTVNPCRSFTNGFVSQGSRNFPYLNWDGLGFSTNGVTVGRATKPHSATLGQRGRSVVLNYSVSNPCTTYHKTGGSAQWYANRLVPGHVSTQ